MSLDLPISITATFILLCLLVFLFFLRMILSPLLSSGRKRLAWGVVIGLAVWIAGQSILSIGGFYLASFELPPRAVLMLLPPILAMLIIFSLYWRSVYFQQLSLKSLTHIQLFRLPLEVFVLASLATAGYISEVMTYYGRNFDVLVGITAPIVAYFYFNRKVMSWKGLLIWNMVSLLLLINVTSHAVLSMPYPGLQQFGLDQPNVAVFHFPFIWLPVLLVQVAYFCQIASIIKLLKYREAA